MCIATLAVAGAAMGAAGQVEGGMARAQQASYQAQVARNNAVIATQNAAYSASAGAAQTEQEGLRQRAKQASVRAGLAANNVDVNSGSAADVQASQREIGQLDTETVANNAALQAYGYQTQATNFQAQSGLYQAEVAPDIAGGILSGAGSFLGNSSVDAALGGGVAPSQLSGEPDIPEGYQWMQTPGGGVDTGA